MTKEEIIQAIIDDKTMPFIQPEQLANIVDFAIKNYKPSLPSNLDEAAVEYAYNNWEDNDYHTGASEGLPFDAIGHTEKCFKAGAEWMAGLVENKEGEVLDRDEFIKFSDGTYIDLVPTQGLIPAFKLKDGDKVIVQIRKVK